MKFDLGDRVIYPHHGAALITAREKRKAFGEEREYLILETAHGDLTLSVPADMADSVGMRPPIDEDDVEVIYKDPSVTRIKQLINHYGFDFIVIGDREYQKYGEITLHRFEELAINCDKQDGDKACYRNGTTVIYRVD